MLAGYGRLAEWAEALQPRRDAQGKLDPILGVTSLGFARELLVEHLELNQTANDLRD